MKVMNTSRCPYLSLIHILESLWVGKPKQAVVAVKDGKIVGAILYKFFQSSGRKVGYLDYAFVDPDFHGQGVGGILYKESAD